MYIKAETNQQHNEKNCHSMRLMVFGLKYVCKCKIHTSDFFFTNTTLNIFGLHEQDKYEYEFIYIDKKEEEKNIQIYSG